MTHLHRLSGVAKFSDGTVFDFRITSDMDGTRIVHNGKTLTGDPHAVTNYRLAIVAALDALLTGPIEDELQ